MACSVEGRSVVAQVGNSKRLNKNSSKIIPCRKILIQNLEIVPLRYLVFALLPWQVRLWMLHAGAHDPWHHGTVPFATGNESRLL